MSTRFPEALFDFAWLFIGGICERQIRKHGHRASIADATVVISSEILVCDALTVAIIASAKPNLDPMVAGRRDGRPGDLQRLAICYPPWPVMPRDIRT
jgi:hypothetical protein